MKRLSAIITLSAICTVFLLSLDASAQGLLGKRYLKVRISRTKPGADAIREIDDSLYKFGSVLNLPITKKIDLDIQIQHLTIKGDISGVDVDITQTAVDGGATLHLSPDERMNPYVRARAGFVGEEIEVSSQGVSAKESDDDLTLSLGVGVEIDLGSQAALSSALEYWRIDTENDVVFRAGLSVWLIESVFAGIDSSYTFDDRNVTVAAIVGLGF